MVVSTDLLLPPTEGDQLHIDPLYVLYLKQVRPVHLFKRYCIKFLLFFSTLVELKFNNIEKKNIVIFWWIYYRKQPVYSAYPLLLVVLFP